MDSCGAPDAAITLIQILAKNHSSHETLILKLLKRSYIPALEFTDAQTPQQSAKLLFYAAHVRISTVLKLIYRR